MSLISPVCWSVLEWQIDRRAVHREYSDMSPSSHESGDTGPSDLRFYTVKEAAEILRVNPRTIQRAIERGNLPAVRISNRGRYRIPRTAIDSLLGNPTTWPLGS
jgi:excisionase family DNA binding protein